MSVTGFLTTDFDVFTINGLGQRMEAIQSKIQPKFKEIGTILTSDLSLLLGNEMHLHIAKHARRTVNPPNDTWLAICENKRGYKKHPHFQVGLFDEHLFIWMALIYELPNKSTIATAYLEQKDTLFNDLPSDFMLSLDHMKKEAELLSELNKDDLTKKLERFRTVKKAEFLIGRHIKRNDPLLQDGDALMSLILQTYEQLLPFYKVAMQS